MIGAVGLACSGEQVCRKTIELSVFDMDNGEDTKVLLVLTRRQRIGLAIDLLCSLLHR